MHVYNITEQNDYYTIFKKVAIEDADGNFITEEELEELEEFSGNKRGWNIMYHTDKIQSLVQEAVDKFNSRDPKRVTVLFEPDFGKDRVKNIFKDQLEEHNLRFIGNRIRRDDRTVLTYNKTSAKKGFCQLVELYLVHVVGYDLKLARLHIKKNQDKVVDLSLKLGITFDTIVEFVAEFDKHNQKYNNVYMYYDTDFDDVNGRIFATEWYNSVVEKMNKPVDL